MLQDQAASAIEVLELNKEEAKDFQASLRFLAALCRIPGFGEGASRLRPHEVLAVALREYSQRRAIDVGSVNVVAERNATNASTSEAAEDTHAGHHRSLKDKPVREGVSDRTEDADGGQSNNSTCSRRMSHWADLPCTVEENLFARLRGKLSPHAARLVCRSWKAGVEHNVTHLTASPRGEDGLGCLCYLMNFRSVEVFKLLVHEEDFEREKVLVPDLIRFIRLQPHFRLLNMTSAEIHCSYTEIESLGSELGFLIEWPENEMEQLVSDPDEEAISDPELDHDWITDGEDDDEGDSGNDDDDDNNSDGERDDDDFQRRVFGRGVSPRQLSYGMGSDEEDEESSSDVGNDADSVGSQMGGHGDLRLLDDNVAELFDHDDENEEEIDGADNADYGLHAQNDEVLEGWEVEDCLEY